jgi:Flp pilus assembly protein CpaB
LSEGVVVTNKLALVVAVVLGVLSIIGIRLYVEGIEKSQIQSQMLIDVLVASKDVPAQRIFGPDDVDVAQLPAAFVDQAFRKSHITDRATVIGLRVVKPIAAGQVLQTYHFQDKVSAAGRLQFDKEYRAITIPISRVGGVAGLLKPADQVDIICNMQLQDRTSGQGMIVTRTLFKNVRILACDTNTDPFVELSGYSSLTLRLRPEDCNKLVYVLFNGGTLHMSYVQPGTAETPSFDPKTADEIFNEVRDEIMNNMRRGG